MTNKKGTVFLDSANRPYLRQKWEGDENEEWLFYWHPEKYWTSLRKIEPTDIFPNNLTQTEQDLYHVQHTKWERNITSTLDY